MHDFYQTSLDTLKMDGRPASSAMGRADEDGDEVADEMGDEEDEELRWKDSGDLLSAAKTP